MTRHPTRLADRLAGRLDGRIGVDPLPSAPDGDDPSTPPEALDALFRADSPEAVLAAAAQADALPPSIREVVARIHAHIDRWERTPRPRSETLPAARRADAVPGPEAGASVDPILDRRMDHLVRRLVRLVHLAEVDRRRYEAQRQVRMAEATPEAVQEATPQAAGPTGTPPPDLGALGRQVLEAVTRILESRQQRRQEEPDVRDVWW